MKITVNLTEHTKTADNQVIKFYKEDPNGEFVGRKFVKDSITYVDMQEDLIWQKRGGDDKKGRVTIPIVELIENRFDPTVFDINRSNARGIFPNGLMICDNRNWSDSNGVIHTDYAEVHEDDLTKEILDTTDPQNPVSFTPKKYQQKLKAGFMGTYDFFKATLGAAIDNSIMSSIDDYEEI